MCRCWGLSLVKVLPSTGLFYEHSNNTIYRDMAYKEAFKLNNGEQEKTYISHGNRSIGTQSKTLLTAKQALHMGTASTSIAAPIRNGTLMLLIDPIDHPYAPH